MDDGPERLKLIHQLRDILQEDCPWICNYHSKSLLLRYDWVYNAKPHPVAMNTFKYRRIDAARRAAQRARWNHPRYDVVIAFLLIVLLSGAPAVAIVRRRSRLTARASRPTLLSSDLTGNPS